MSGNLTLVEMIYDFEPADDIEQEAFKEFVYPPIYSATMVFKNAGKSKERAAAFLDKINDISEISDLLGGPPH